MFLNTDPIFIALATKLVASCHKRTLRIALLRETPDLV